MKSLKTPAMLKLKKETVRKLNEQDLRVIGGGLPVVACGDDSSGNGLLCPVYYQKTR
jgi:hypothetical protein